MAGKQHPLGFCTCASHSERPWRRSEHWTAAEVAYLEVTFGKTSDARIAGKLGRSVVGIRLKAKRLGLRTRDAGFTSRDVARLFGVDETTVSKGWIRRHGVMRSTRPYRQGPHMVHLIMESELERFIREHGEYIDPERMPDSVYRDLARAGGRWYPLPAVQQMTGRNCHILAAECRDGRWPARRRGTHWMLHESSIEAVRATAGRGRTLASEQLRERTLEHRRNVRKGVERPRPHPLRRVA